MPSEGKYATGLIAGKHETAVKCREVRWQQVLSAGKRVSCAKHRKICHRYQEWKNARWTSRDWFSSGC